jgi:hypothetical protein
VPERRTSELTAVAAVQFDSTEAHRGDGAAAARDRAARTADAYPARTPVQRRLTAAGYAVEIRNGMPEPAYRIVTDTLRCGCSRRLRPALMEWELTSACDQHRRTQ